MLFTTKQLFCDRGCTNGTKCVIIKGYDGSGKKTLTYCKACDVCYNRRSDEIQTHEEAVEWILGKN